MPELPEIETIRRGLEPRIVGCDIEKVVLYRDGLRRPFPEGFADILSGSRIVDIFRRAKYLLLRISRASFAEGDYVWVVHLGMSGKFLLCSDVVDTSSSDSLLVACNDLKVNDKHTHVRVLLSRGMELLYNDARRFGLMTVVKYDDLWEHELFVHLGVEPLGEEFSANYLENKIIGRRTSIKNLLMDNHIVVGVGNIYACESLFRAGVHPCVSGDGVVDIGKCEDLVVSVKEVLREAIEAGGSTLRDYATASGEQGYFQHNFRVYGRKGLPCFVCGEEIVAISQAGRTSYFCPRCQRL